MFGRILNTPMYLQVLLSLQSSASVLGSASDIFRHIQALFKNIFTHSETFCVLSIFKTLAFYYHKAYLNLWYIPDTMLNIFTKAQSWKFDSVLNAPVFYRCYLTSRVTLRIFNVIFQTYSGIFKTYLAIFRPAKAYQYPCHI